MTESSKPQIEEIKTYMMLHDLYYRSARPSSDFDAELFHKLRTKYEGIDIVKVVLDAHDEALARIKSLETDYEGALSDLSEMNERMKVLEEVLEDSHATLRVVINCQEGWTLEQERIGNKGICIPAMRKIEQALASARETIGGGE